MDARATISEMGAAVRRAEAAIAAAIGAFAGSVSDAATGLAMDTWIKWRLKPQRQVVPVRVRVRQDGRRDLL